MGTNKYFPAVLCSNGDPGSLSRVEEEEVVAEECERGRYVAGEKEEHDGSSSSPRDAMSSTKDGREAIMVGNSEGSWGKVQRATWKMHLD